MCDLTVEKYPRGTDTSMELSEVRTVLSRAETALQNWDSHRDKDDINRDEMAQDLGEVIWILDRWRRTGRTKKVSL